MRRYKVTAADKETGREEIAIISAEDQNDAERQATELGLMWSLVVPEESEESTTSSEGTGQPSAPPPAPPLSPPPPAPPLPPPSIPAPLAPLDASGDLLGAVQEILGVLRGSSLCNKPRKIDVPGYLFMLFLGGSLMVIGGIAVVVAIGFALAALGSEEHYSISSQTFYSSSGQYWTIAVAAGISGLIYLAVGQGILALRDIARNSWVVRKVIMPKDVDVSEPML